MSEIKYIHIMPNGSVLHNSKLIKMVHDSDLFIPSEHKFYVYSKAVYEANCKYDNVEWVDGNVKDTNLFCRLAEKGDNIFLHWNLFNPLLVLKIPTKIWKKIIWVEWGTDIERGKDIDEGFFKHLVRMVFWPLADRKLRKIRAIGIGAKTDNILVYKRFGFSVPIARCCISEPRDEEYHKSLLEASNKKLANTPNSAFRIMAGYSTYPNQKHKEILDKLSAYKDENIIVSLFSGHGQDAYAARIVEYAKNIFGDKCEYIDHRMDFEDFFHYLNTCDAVVFNQQGQLALGTINLLLYMGKKIYLPEDSYTKKMLDLDGATSFRIDELGKMPFKEICDKNFDTSLGRKLAEFKMFQSDAYALWAKTFKDIERGYI